MTAEAIGPINQLPPVSEFLARPDLSLVPDPTDQDPGSLLAAELVEECATRGVMPSSSHYLAPARLTHNFVREKTGADVPVIDPAAVFRAFLSSYRHNNSNDQLADNLAEVAHRTDQFVELQILDQLEQAFRPVADSTDSPTPFWIMLVRLQAAYGQVLRTGRGGN